VRARPIREAAQLTSESSVATGKAASLIRHPPLLFYLLARSCSEFAYQVAAVAIGWQIYARAPDDGLSGAASSRRIGLRMFEALIAFGVATAVFALSHHLWLTVPRSPRWAQPTRSAS
jgi:hypothetical protein